MTATDTNMIPTSTGRLLEWGLPQSEQCSLEASVPVALSVLHAIAPHLTLAFFDSCPPSRAPRTNRGFTICPPPRFRVLSLAFDTKSFSPCERIRSSQALMVMGQDA